MRFLVPLEVESFEQRRKRELLGDLRLYDGGLASLLEEIGEARRECGLGFYLHMPTSMKSPRMQALQSGLIQLGQWRNAVLSELATL